MLAASESSLIIPSFSRALVVSATTGLFIDLTIVPISLADSKITDARYSNKTTKLPVSDEERQRYLDELQSATTKTMIPAIAFLVFLAVTGLIGNSLVIYVYSRRLQWSATRILIIAIAMCDLIANVLAIPAEIYDMLHIWDFNNPLLCRVRLFVTAFPTLSSAIILVAVAVTRYRKVCRPYAWQITTKKATLIGIAFACLGALMSCPSVILNGRRTKKTPRSDVVGYECTTDDEYVDSNLPLANYLFFLLLYFIASVSLTVLYVLLGMKTWKHSVALSSMPPIPSTQTISTSASKGMEQPCDGNQNNPTRLGTNNNNNNLHKSIISETASRVEDIKVSQFHISDEGTDASVQYGIRAFIDGTEIRTPMVGEFFVQLEKTKPGVADISSQESSTYDIDNERTVQKGDDVAADLGTGVNKVVEDNITERVTKSVQSSLGNIDSNQDYNERCTRNTGNKSEAARTNSEINANLNTTFHSKEWSEKPRLVYQCHSNVHNLCNGVDNNGHYIQSIQRAADEALHKSDPLSMFNSLDVVHCSEDEHTTCDSICVEGDAGLPLWHTLTNRLLQQNSWLRTSVIETKASQDETAENSSFDRVPEQSGPVDITPSGKKVSGAYQDSRIFALGPSQLTKSVSRIEFREMLTLRMSLPKSESRFFNRRSTGRISLMLIIISAIYILDYLPHLGLMITKLVSPDLIANMSASGCTLYHLFMRSYFINCAINPIVYSLCDSSFRRESFKLCKCS
ncbi:hypothetical protein BsWGS_14057 [Bradybaena similaris]